jgi:hypothetical protein
MEVSGRLRTLTVCVFFMFGRMYLGNKLSGGAITPVWHRWLEETNLDSYRASSLPSWSFVSQI